VGSGSDAGGTAGTDPGGGAGPARMPRNVRLLADEADAARAALLARRAAAAAAAAGPPPLLATCAARVLAGLSGDAIRAGLPAFAAEELFYWDGRGPRALEEFLARLDLQGPAARPPPARGGDAGGGGGEGGEGAVQIMTVHQSKGLEWPVVFVPRFNDGFFPVGGPPRGREAGAGGEGGWAAEGGEEEEVGERLELEEEHRLAHVAFTRARLRLFVSRIRRLASDAGPRRRWRALEPSPIPLPPAGAAGGSVLRETDFSARADGGRVRVESAARA
jgi:superfamily I DNA/RNA helicase